MNSLTLTWWKLSGRLRLLSLVLFVGICKKMWRAASWERAEIVCTDLSSCCRASAAQHCVLFLGSALPGAVTLCSICWEQWGGLRVWAQLSWLCANTCGTEGSSQRFTFSFTPRFTVAFEVCCALRLLSYSRVTAGAFRTAPRWQNGGGAGSPHSRIKKHMHWFCPSTVKPSQ